MFCTETIINRTKKWIAGCLQLKNDKKSNLRTSKLNKDLSQIKCFQCCFSTENSHSVSFYFETKWLCRME